MSRGTTTGHAVENTLLLVLAIFLPPCAVACVTGCGMLFVVNLIFTLFLSYIGGVVHAICIVVIYGFREKEMPRVRRQARLRANLYNDPTPPLPPRYDNRPAYSTAGARDKARAKHVYVASRASTGSAFARGSVNTTRGGDDYGLGVYPPPDEAAPGGTAYGETLVGETRETGEDRKIL